jgi:hypothetical protein
MSEPVSKKKPPTSSVPCRYFQQSGSCRRGDTCRYAHTIPTPTPNTSASTSDAHPVETSLKKKQRGICRFYRQTQHCKLGEACPFRHVLPRSESQPVTKSLTDQLKEKYSTHFELQRQVITRYSF